MICSDQASSSTDQQKWLEQSLLKLNYKSFTQIIILGSTNFVPFMQLSSQHRREVVEDLLDIKVFSSMNDVAKVKIKGLKDEIKELGYKKENVEDKIISQQDLIEKLKKRKTQDIESRKEKIILIDTEINQLIDDNTIIQNQVDEKTKQLDDLSFSDSLLKKLEKLNIKIEQKISNLVEEHQFSQKRVSAPGTNQFLQAVLQQVRSGRPLLLFSTPNVPACP